MNPPARWGIAGLAILDVLLGLLLMVWPGAFQEWTHPLAMGVAFYAVQRTGALWLVRGLIGGYAAVRGRRVLAGVVAASWCLDALPDLLVAWRAADTGPNAAWVHGGHGLLAVLAGILAWRLLTALGHRDRRSAERGQEE